MRYFILKVLLFSLILFFIHPDVGQSFAGTSAQHAVLMDKDSGQVLYEKNGHEKNLIASTTKIMTAILAVELGNLQDEVTVSRRAVYTEGSSIYLTEGERMSLEDLLYGLMLRSGNDAAVAIAEHIGGSVEGFVLLMNEKAQYIGMTNTRFANPHGLDHEHHYSTAYDMALLKRYAMDNDMYQTISETKSYLSEKRFYKWFNKNKLLTKLYEHCNGGKTGFTKKAGRTLITSAEKDGHELIVVTLNAPDDWNDHIRLYEWGFQQLNERKQIEKSSFEWPLLEQLDEDNLSENTFDSHDRIEKSFFQHMSFVMELFLRVNSHG